jgi:hypothetical protein
MQTHLQRLVLWLNDATAQSTDTESIRIRKFAAASIQFIGLISLLMWAVVFIALGYWTAAVINLISVSLIIINLAMFVWTKDLTSNVNSILGVTPNLGVCTTVCSGRLIQVWFREHMGCFLSSDRVGVA